MQLLALRPRICRNRPGRINLSVRGLISTMIKKTVLLFLLCSVLPSVYAQRIIEKSLVNKHARFFYVDSGLAYKVLLRTHASQEIKLRATVEGEYQNEIVLNIQDSGSEFFIGTSFSPEFQFKNDKLSAHKVISIALEISVPEKLSVYLKGDYTNLNASGSYELLDVNLKEGRCYLDQTLGEISVITQSGGIVLLSSEGYIEAETEYGKIDAEQLPLGEAVYNLKSSSGNIQIIKKL